MFASRLGYAVIRGNHVYHVKVTMYHRDDTQNCNWCMIILVIQAKSWLLQLMLYQYIRYVELSAHSRSKCTMQMTLSGISSSSSSIPVWKLSRRHHHSSSLEHNLEFKFKVIFQSILPNFMVQKSLKKCVQHAPRFEIEQAILVDVLCCNECIF